MNTPLHQTPESLTHSCAYPQQTVCTVLPHRTPRAKPPQSILVNRRVPHIHDDQNNPPNSGEVQPNQPCLFLSRPEYTYTGWRIHDRHKPPNNTDNAILANVIWIPTPSTVSNKTVPGPDHHLLVGQAGKYTQVR